MYTLVYNGYTLQDDQDHLVISKLDGLGLPPIRTSEQNLTGADGGNVWERRYGMRTIVIEGDIFSDDLSDYYTRRDALVLAFSIHNSTELAITRSDGVTKTIAAKVVYGPDLIESVGNRGEARFRIELRCDNPFFQDENTTIVTVALATGGGTPVASPLPSPVGIGTGGTVTIDNTGDTPINPKFTISGNASIPNVGNTSTGKSFTINRSITIGNIEEIFKNQGGFFCNYNGLNDIPNFQGNYITLEAGSNTITFNASSYDSSALLTIEYTNQYLTL